VNKKVLGIALTVFFLAMLTIPVMAAPAKKIEGVTIEVVGGSPVPYEGSPWSVSDGTIGHGKGYVVPGATVTLTIPTVGTYEDGVWESEWTANSNRKKRSMGCNNYFTLDNDFR